MDCSVFLIKSQRIRFSVSGYAQKYHIYLISSIKRSTHPRDNTREPLFFINFITNENNRFTNPPHIDRLPFLKCRPLRPRIFHELIDATNIFHLYFRGKKQISRGGAGHQGNYLTTEDSEITEIFEISVKISTQEFINPDYGPF
jgi:hypothetical protein